MESVRQVENPGEFTHWHLLSFGDDSQPVAPNELKIQLICDKQRDLDAVMEFCNRYGSDYQCSMVEPFKIRDRDRLAFVKWLMSLRAIDEKTMIVVLVGTETFRQVDVDWEIAAALAQAPKNIGGLVGILLPELLGASNRGANWQVSLPARLSANAATGYAKLVTWQHVMRSEKNFRDTLYEAQNQKNCGATPCASRLPLRRLQRAGRRG